jgi:hypothetical protein
MIGRLKIEWQIADYPIDGAKGHSSNPAMPS